MWSINSHTALLQSHDCIGMKSGNCRPNKKFLQVTIRACMSEIYRCSSLACMHVHILSHLCHYRAHNYTLWCYPLHYSRHVPWSGHKTIIWKRWIWAQHLFACACVACMLTVYYDPIPRYAMVMSGAVEIHMRCPERHTATTQKTSEAISYRTATKNDIK